MGNIITKKEAMQFGKLEIDEDDMEENYWIEVLVDASETYLKNATGKEYLERIEGVAQAYPLEKIYCGMLINFWYDNRDMLGTTNNEFSEMTRALMCQLKV